MLSLDLDFIGLSFSDDARKALDGDKAVFGFHSSPKQVSASKLRIKPRLRALRELAQIQQAAVSHQC